MTSLSQMRSLWFVYGQHFIFSEFASWIDTENINHTSRILCILNTCKSNTCCEFFKESCHWNSNTGDYLIKCRFDQIARFT